MRGNYTPKPSKSQSYIPHPNQKFIDSDKLDARLLQQWRDGADMKHARKYLVDQGPGKLQIPATWYALSVLGPENGIKKLDEHCYLTVAHDPDGEPFVYYYAIVKVGKGFGKLATSRNGASGWIHPPTAIDFAHRNAIRQVLPQEALTYSITRRNIFEAKAEVIRRYI